MVYTFTSGKSENKQIGVISDVLCPCSPA